MKKFSFAAWLLVFSLVLTVAFSGCMNGKLSKNSGAEGREIVVGFSQVGTESDWRKANTVSMTQALSEENGYRLIFDDAQQKIDRQVTAVRNFIQQGVDYIVLAPVTEEGWDTVLAEAKNAGIPVIIVDRKVNVDDEDLFTCWVGTNSRGEADIAVKWMDEQFGSSPIKIAHVQGTLGSSAQLGRTAGFDEGLAQHPNWELTFRGTGDFTQAQGRKVVQRLLDDGTEFDVIFAENDDMAYGAVEALEEAGLEPGKDVTIISFDANRHALELALEGKINYVVECSPLHGPRVQAIIEQLEAGETPEKYSYVEGGAFEAGKITQELIDGREY